MCVFVRERKRLCGGQGSQFWGTVDDTILVADLRKWVLGLDDMILVADL